MKEKIKKGVKISLLIIFAVFSGVIFYLIGTSYGAFNEKKSLITKDESIYPVKIYDRKGRFIDEISKNRKSYAKLEDMPKYLKSAFIAVEDKDYYKHSGINIGRIAGALTVNIKKGEKDQGASTITQQMVKNVILKDFKKTYTRKIKEIFVSLMVEKEYSKEQILQKYLNEVYYGNGITGVKEGAYTILGKQLDELTLYECALLAAVPNNPSKYSLYKNMKNADARAKMILSLMKEQNMINEDEYNEALTEKAVPDSLDRVYNYPDITDLIKRELKTINENIYNSKIETFVNTSIDLDFHKVNLNTFENYKFIKENQGCQYSSVTVNPKNGEILTIAAGAGFAVDKFNRAVQMKRQIGSVFKPFVYFSEIINNGLTPLDKVVDEPITIDGWSPKNIDWKNYGEVVVDVALERSLNTIPVRLLKKSGFEGLKNVMKKINPEIKIPELYSTALGTIELSPMEVAQMYSVFANGGKRIAPHAIINIKGIDGKEFYKYKDTSEQVFDEADTAVMANLLRNVVTYGTAFKAHIRGVDIGGKTGTADENKSVWFAGFTEELVVIDYLGYDKGKDLGHAAGDIAAPVFKEYMLNLRSAGLYTPSERFKYIAKLVREKKVRFVFQEVGLKEEERLNPETMQMEMVRTPRVREILLKQGD